MMCHIALLKISCYASFLLNTTKDFIMIVLDHKILQQDGAQLANIKMQMEPSKNQDGVQQTVQEVCYPQSTSLSPLYLFSFSMSSFNWIMQCSWYHTVFAKKLHM